MIVVFPHYVITYHGKTCTCVYEKYIITTFSLEEVIVFKIMVEKKEGDVDSLKTNFKAYFWYNIK